MGPLVRGLTHADARSQNNPLMTDRVRGHDRADGDTGDPANPLMTDVDFTNHQ